LSQSHFTLRFPLTLPVDAKALAQELSPLMPALFQAEDAIGTVHYSRFTVLSDKTLLFLADFDGKFGQLMLDLAKHAGPVFDAIFRHTDDPPQHPSRTTRTRLLIGRRATSSPLHMSTAPTRGTPKRSRRWPPPQVSKARANCFRSW
jgi:hypothetical protein